LDGKRTTVYGRDWWTFFHVGVRKNHEKRFFPINFHAIGFAPIIDDMQLSFSLFNEHVKVRVSQNARQVITIECITTIQ
jgi:hypothetical protein